MKECKRCGKERPITSFQPQSRDKTKRRNVCNSCKYKREKERETEAQKEKKREYYRNYHKRHPEVARYKAYCSDDRRRIVTGKHYAF